MIGIGELREIKCEKEQLEKRERELAKPALEDFSLLPTLYEWFNEILADMPSPSHSDSVIRRKKFLFIAMILYCPDALLGYKMKSGLRKELAEMLNISASVISNNVNDLLFIYSHYNTFMLEIERIYGNIIMRIEKIRDNGAIVTYLN
jgi:hypothetical protein